MYYPAIKGNIYIYYDNRFLNFFLVQKAVMVTYYTINMHVHMHVAHGMLRYHNYYHCTIPVYISLAANNCAPLKVALTVCTPRPNDSRYWHITYTWTHMEGGIPTYYTCTTLSSYN